MPNVCTPIRVDHLDGNNSNNVHQVCFLPDPTNDRVWIAYDNLKVGASTYRGGVFLREYNYVTKTLGAVLTISDDNTGTGRDPAFNTNPTFPLIANLDNRHPRLFKLTDGTLVCVYGANVTATAGICVKETVAPHDGTSWTVEVPLIVPWSSANQGMNEQVLDGYCDGTDIFLIVRAPAGSGVVGSPVGYGTEDIMLLHRTSLGVWSWSRIVNNVPALSHSDYGTNPGQNFWFGQVAPGEWRMLFVGAYGLNSGVTQGVYCWTNQSAKLDNEWSVGGTGDNAPFWMKSTVHDFSGQSYLDRRPIVTVGSDGVVRLVYFSKVGGVVGGAVKAYGATSVDYGQHWNDLGELDPATVNTSTWDPTHDASFSIDSMNRWIPSTVWDPPDGGLSYAGAFSTWLTDQDDNTGWIHYSKCDIDLSGETIYLSGPGLSYWVDNRLLRGFEANTPTFNKYYLLDISIPTTLPPTCLNSQIRVCYWDTVTVCAEDVTADHSYSWTGPNGFVSTDRCFTIVVRHQTEGRYTVRITDDVSGLWVECIHIIVGENCNPPPPPPGTFEFIERQENRLFRRGVIKVRDTGIHQGKAYTVAEVEILDKPNWGGN